MVCRFLCLLFILISLKSFAVNTATASFGISATVPVVVNITVSPVSVASNLNFLTAQTNLLVATVQESSNSSAGYKIYAQSLNGSLFNLSTYSIPYTFSYAGTTYSLSSAGTNVLVKNQTTGSNYINVISNVMISYGAVNPFSKKPGNYTDTIVFTIQGS